LRGDEQAADDNGQRQSQKGHDPVEHAFRLILPFWPVRLIACDGLSGRFQRGPRQRELLKVFRDFYG
jgi:hypothetical protein